MSLLNLNNIPENEISGLSDEMLEWVTTESGERYITELSKSFQEDLKNMEVYYEDVDDEILQVITNTEAAATPTSTKIQTERHVKRFKAFLEENKLSTEIEKVPINILVNYLCFFYYSLKTKDGKPYSASSLICIRAAIQRYLNSPNVDRRINIIDDVQFKRANGILKAMVKKWMNHEGTSNVKYDSIDKDDLVKIKDYFTRDTPDVLQEEAWFSIVYYLALRGREVLRDLPKNALEFLLDASGREYIYINTTYITKNVRVSLSTKDFENLSQARIYDVPECPNRCPVSCLRLYLSKIKPDCNLLFPIPLKKYRDQTFWYCEKRSLGVNSIGSFMKRISEKAKLKKIYTNHCLRVTVVSTLRDSGLQSNDIAAVTGHKNVQSVERYVRRKKDGEKRLYSQMLNTSLLCVEEMESSSTTTTTSTTLIKEKIRLDASRECHISSDPNKKMKIEANMETNVVTITFE